MYCRQIFLFLLLFRGTMQCLAYINRTLLWWTLFFLPSLFSPVLESGVDLLSSDSTTPVIFRTHLTHVLVPDMSFRSQLQEHGQEMISEYWHGQENPWKGKHGQEKSHPKKNKLKMLLWKFLSFKKHILQKWSQRLSERHNEFYYT